MAELSPIAWVQRLGYLLERVGAPEKAKEIAVYIQKKQPVRTPRTIHQHQGGKNGEPLASLSNTDVEPDL